MANISQAGMRGTIYKALFSTLDANKPTGWTIKSKMPKIKKINDSLPLIVFNVAITDTDLITLDKTSARDFSAVGDFFFVVKDTNKGSEDLDIGVDNIRNTLLDNQTVWTAAGFFVTKVTEELSDMEISGGSRLLTDALSVQIKPITN